MGLLFMEVFDVLDPVFQEMEKGCKERRRRSGKDWGAGGVTVTFIARSVPLRTECNKVVSHVFSTALKWQLKMALECRQNNKNPPMGVNILRLTSDLDRRQEKTGWITGRGQHG